MSLQPTSSSITTGNAASAGWVIVFRTHPRPLPEGRGRGWVLLLLPLVLAIEFLEIIERLVHGADRRAGHAALRIQVAEKHQVFELLRLLQLLPGAVAECARAVLQCEHVVLDQP